MNLVVKILPYGQIILSVVLVTAIMLQQSGSSVGGALGGSDTGSFHHTRRGFEKFLFVTTIVVSTIGRIKARMAVNICLAGTTGPVE